MSNVLMLGATGISDLASIILSYRSTPVIGTIPSSGFVNNLITGGIAISAGIWLYAETYDEHSAADVSKQLIMAIDQTRKWVADNIAPQPREWDISGYLQAKVGNIVQVPTAFLGQFLLTAQKVKLEQMQRSRQTYQFKTVDGELVPNVAIVDLHFAPTAAAGNVLPFQIKLQEMPYLTSLEASDPAQAAAIPFSGGEFGDATPIGSVPATIEDTSSPDSVFSTVVPIWAKPSTSLTQPVNP